MTGVTREDVLIGRVVDNEASTGDWAELERLSRDDAGVWARLADAQRTHARLASAVEDQVAIAELVEARPVRFGGGSGPGVLGRLGGWAVAAGIGAAWLLTMTLGAPRGGPQGPGRIVQAPPRSSGSVVDGPEVGVGGLFVDSMSSERAFDEYKSAAMREDRFVTELPPLLVEARRTPGGDGYEYEAIVIRRPMERIKVKDVSYLRVLTDEYGNPAGVAEEPPPVVGDKPL